MVVSSNQEKTQVIILGTAHIGGNHAPEYIVRLRAIIEEINPDVLCAELSPEQLDGKTTCDSKPEYPDAILPVAREYEIKVVPIQPTTDEGTEIEKEKIAIINRIKANEQDRIRWEFLEHQAEITAGKWLKVLKDPTGIENVQLREFDLLQMEPCWIANEHFFPKLAEQWNNWNQYFLDRINATIRDHARKKLLVTVGLAHKYWLWNRLRSRNDIILHDLQSFRKAQEND